MKISSCLAAIPFAFSTGALTAALPPPPPEPLPLVPEPMAIPEESVESLSAPSEDETLHPHLAWEAATEKHDSDQPTSPNTAVHTTFTRVTKPIADCVLVGGQPVDQTWLWLTWTPSFNHSTIMTTLSVVPRKQCVPIMCERSTGGAYWCNDSDNTKTALWRELTEYAGQVFIQCMIGIRSSGQTQFDDESRIIVTDPRGQGCNLSYDTTLETRGKYTGIWPEDLEDLYRRAAQVQHTKRQLLPLVYPPAGTSGLMSSTPTEISQSPEYECSSVVGRLADFGDARGVWNNAMQEYKDGKMCTLGPKKCMAVGCNGNTVGFFWCNDSMETRTKRCFETVERAFFVIFACRGGGFGKQATTGGTYFDEDERVFVVRPIDGRCELEYERTERAFDPADGFEAGWLGRRWF